MIGFGAVVVRALLVFVVVDVEVVASDETLAASDCCARMRCWSAVQVERDEKGVTDVAGLGAMPHLPMTQPPTLRVIVAGFLPSCEVVTWTGSVVGVFEPVLPASEFGAGIELFAATLASKECDDRGRLPTVMILALSAVMFVVDITGGVDDVSVATVTTRCGGPSG